MTVWELAARHQECRKSKLLVTCRKIEVELDRRPWEEQKILHQLAYYVPVHTEETVYQ